jgi:hypothetical protein
MENNSKTVLVIEVVLTVLPVTLLFLMFIVPGYIWNPNEIALNRLSANIVFAISAAALVCAWFLILIFLSGGRARLRRTLFVWWIFPTLAVFGSVFAILGSVTIGDSSMTLYKVSSDLRLFLFGAPMVLPYFHLVLERFSPVKR